MRRGAHLPVPAPLRALLERVVLLWHVSDACFISLHLRLHQLGRIAAQLPPQVVHHWEVRGGGLHLFQHVPPQLDNHDDPIWRDGRCSGRASGYGVSGLLLQADGLKGWAELLPFWACFGVRLADDGRWMLRWLGVRHDVPHSGEHGHQAGAHHT